MTPLRLHCRRMSWSPSSRTSCSDVGRGYHADAVAPSTVTAESGGTYCARSTRARHSERSLAGGSPSTRWRMPATVAPPHPLRFHPGAVSLLPLELADARTLRVDGDRHHCCCCHEVIDGRPALVGRWIVDIVMECTGVFSTTGRLAGAAPGVRRPASVLFSQPAQAGCGCNTVVYGVNHTRSLRNRAQHRIQRRPAPPTAIVPVISRDRRCAFGIEHGTITTIHSAMNDQPVLDAYHHTDLRKTRAASTLGHPGGHRAGAGAWNATAARSWRERFSAQALRVPTLNVSAHGPDGPGDPRSRHRCRTVSIAFWRDAVGNPVYDGVLGYTEELLASCDFNP